jgi:glucokinase-like ROK family protein
LTNYLLSDKLFIIKQDIPPDLVSSSALYPSFIDCNVKNINKRISLELIRFTPGGISRSEVARQLGLTRAAVTVIIGDLIDSGLVHETEDGPATGGRRPIMLEINPRRGYLVGIDLGATHYNMLVTDFAGRVLNEAEARLDIRMDPECYLKKIDDALHAMLADAQLSLEDVLAIGMGVPGPISTEAGTVIAPPIMPGWDKYPIRINAQKLWSKPVSLNNDAELGALGEWAHGAGRGERHLAYIKVGTGVGAGLLLDGKIFQGATGCAGEVGHVTVRDDGPLCTCGNYGCLEAMAGGGAIAKKAREAVLAGKRTQLASIRSVDEITARDVAHSARLGDLVAQQIIAEAGGYLGIGIASLVNVFNPSMIVIGGGVAQVGDLLLDPIRQVVRDRSLRSAAQAVRITAAVLGRRSTSMGAVVQALNIALDQLTAN